MRKLIAFMTCVLLVLSAAAWAAADDSALTLDELNSWAAALKQQAMQSTPENDPADPRSNTEDGYCFKYDFATLYMDRPEMTEEAVLLEAVIPDMSEYAGPRGTHIDDSVSAVIGAYYSENDTLDGDYNFALLYLSDTMPSGAMWAWVMRDGQRVQAIQYTVHDQLTTGGDGYTDAGVIYTIQSDLVAAIRVYGLTGRVSEEDVRANVREAQQLADTHGYTRVPSSVNGASLEKLKEKDLTFAGISFTTATPEEAIAAYGEPLEDIWFEDDDGTWLRTMDFGACSLTFTYNSKKKEPVLYMFSITRDTVEGPRAVRIGDSFASVLNRFRNGEGEYDDNTMTEMLYGTVDTDFWGCAEYYDDASAQLHYTTTVSTGVRVSLYMHFEVMVLDEIMIYYY